jgi:hypothetical protein
VLIQVRVSTVSRVCDSSIIVVAAYFAGKQDHGEKDGSDGTSGAQAKPSDPSQQSSTGQIADVRPVQTRPVQTGRSTPEAEIVSNHAAASNGSWHVRQSSQTGQAAQSPVPPSPAGQATGAQGVRLPAQPVTPPVDPGPAMDASDDFVFVETHSHLVNSVLPSQNKVEPVAAGANQMAGSIGLTPDAVLTITECIGWRALAVSRVGDGAAHAAQREQAKSGPEMFTNSGAGSATENGTGGDGAGSGVDNSGNLFSEALMW